MNGLPSGWAETQLGSLIERVEAGLNVKCEERPPQGKERGLVKISAVTWGRFNEEQSKTLPADIAVSANAQIQTGDLLFSRANTIELVGATVLVEEIEKRLYLSDKVLRLVVPAESKRWINYAMKTAVVRKAIQDASSGNQLSMRNISQEKLRQIPIPLAPLPEQKRIADKLDSVLARVDACRDRLDHLPALLKRFRQSILAAATSGRLTEDWRQINNCETGKIDKLGQMGEVIAGQSPSVSEVNLLGKGVPYVTGPEQWDGKKILAHKWTEFPKRIAPDNSIFVTVKGAGVGKTFPGCYSAIGRDVYAFVPNNGHDKNYVLYAIQASAEAVVTKAKGLIPGLTKSDIADHPAYIPSSPEQAEIVRRVELLFAFADRLEARLATARRQVGQLTPALLAKAFRGELVPQDPADEPAAELLKRLAAQRAAAPAGKRSRAGVPGAR
ncbi:MAG TPA: restriction endonuclease subunit S [Verrucomicrobiota bacterium]|nr:restriction endonuclease subunit S [Verrucomicrobiota bacterium]